MEYLVVVFLVCLMSCYLVVSQHPNRLLVISFEGFEADDFNDKLTPNIVKLKQSGFCATNVKNVVPHHTLPNLVSVATGLSPQDHGILGSTLHEPKSNRILTTTQPEFWDQLKDVSLIWELNEKASKDHYSGVMKWPGVDRGALPTFRVTYDPLESRRKLVDLGHDFDTVQSWFSDRETPANMVMFFVPFPKTMRLSIIGDGNCLFRALSYGLYHTEERHAEVRQRIVAYVVEHWADLLRAFSDYYLSDSETYNLMLKYKLEGDNQRKSFVSKFINPAEEHSEERCSAEEDKCVEDEYYKVDEIEERTGECLGQSDDDERGVPTSDYRKNINSGLYECWMGSDKVWGTMFEIAIFFKVFQRPVCVNMVNPVSGELQQLSTFTFHDGFQPTKPVEGPLISLLWNGNNQNGHFDILLHPVECEISPSPVKTMKALHLAKVDRLLKNLMSGLEKKGLLQDMNMVLLSDHNMRIVYSEDIVYLRDKVPEDQCLLLGKSPVMHAVPQPGYSSTSVLLRLMQIEGFGDKFKVFTQEQLPEEWNLKNSIGNPSLLVVAQTGSRLHAFDDVASQMQLHFLTYQEEKLPARLGILVDGYAPRNAEMPGTIIAIGPVTRELNHTESLSSLELFKLLLHVLEIHQD